MNKVINKLIQMTKDDKLFWRYTEDGYETDYDNVVVVIEYGDLTVGSVIFLDQQYPLIETLEECMFNNIDRQIKTIVKLKTVDDVIDTVMGW